MPGKWCTGCKTEHPKTAFGKDSSRGDGLDAKCLMFRKRRYSETFIPSDRMKPMGPAPDPSRDGDKKQARHRVNLHVQNGRLPHPNTIPCYDCLHIWNAGERRHEYDHYLGYSAENHLEVQSVCTTCHGSRERNRGIYGGAHKKIGPEGTSWCSGCKEFLPIDQFSKDISHWNGLDLRCKYHNSLRWAAYKGKEKWVTSLKFNGQMLLGEP